MSKIDFQAAVRSQHPPRDASAARRFASKMEPWWGFLLYGVLILFASNAVGMLVVTGIMALLRGAIGTPQPGWAVALDLAAYLAGFVLIWWLFLRWARRRRRAMRTLYREGQLVQAEVVSAFPTPRLFHARFRFEVEGQPWKARLAVALEQRHTKGLEEGAVYPVLFHPACHYLAVFTADGDVHAAPVKRA